jgi:hypothetical protein
MSPDLRGLLISFTVVGAVVLGFAWGFARLPPWALAPPLAGLAWGAAWMLTARYDHNRPALIGGFIALLVFYALGAYIPDLILSVVLD